MVDSEKSVSHGLGLICPHQCGLLTGPGRKA